MYRRRRPKREKIAFSFDSFLDVVANVIGIIVRLILVTWVGAQSYRSTMNWVENAPPPTAMKELPSLKASDDPVSAEIQAMRDEIDKARSALADRLSALERIEQEQSQEKTKVAQLASRRRELETDAKALEKKIGEKAAKSDEAALTLEELKARSKKLLDEIKAVQAEPAAKQALRYRAPVSSIVFADEVHFECRNGRVTYFDLPAFKHEIDGGLESKAAELKTTWKVNATTAPVGPFRLRYVVERERDHLEALGASRPTNQQFRYGMSEWTLEPLSEIRGETTETALSPGSQFRALVDKLDSRVTVVTLWVYPDSFASFRRLRDYLHDRDLEVAGRPLPEGAPIAASRHGTASRGQ
jgi:hypothetical protein